MTERFSFGRFMDVAVARMARKPLRIALTLHHLSAALNVDAGLATVRDFFERSARDMHKKPASGWGSSGGDQPLPPREPLEVQLEALNLWHASLSQLLRSFKSRFRSMGCTLLAHADAEVFQVAAEGVHYDGPLKLRIPLDVSAEVCTFTCSRRLSLHLPTICGSTAAAYTHPVALRPGSSSAPSAVPLPGCAGDR